MFLCDALPPEICKMVWDHLPLRTRVTTTKASYEQYYYAIVQDIPRIGGYMLHIIRNNRSSYIFNMLLSHKQEAWKRLGRWKQLNGCYAGVYDNYISFLRHVCRHNNNYICLLVLCQKRSTNSDTVRLTSIERTYHSD